ncbi:MAG TPA: IS1182 family transposase [Blastocatellia bacterium]|nr:IS1182 family transposase [Blastocatellia bacterium]
MRPSTWQPPIETSAVEDQIIKRIKRARLFIFLRQHRHQIFTSEFQDELAGIFKDSLRGQPPVPPAMLALALILQAYTGVSDDEVIEATLMDRRWQLALDCLDAQETPFSKGTFVAFRTRLIEHQMDRRLVERTIEIAEASKAFGPRNLRAALDSSPLWGAGRVEDTYNLLGHALRKALGVIAREQGRALAAIAQEADAELVAGSSLKATLDLDWGDSEARGQALRQVLQTLERVEQWMSVNPELITKETVVPACLEAARQVRTQDVTTNEAGEAVLIKGVAKDRRISIEDAEMRHGRKSRSVRVDGYKRHVMRDLDSELVVAVGVTPANAPEAKVAEGIKKDLDQQQITLKELHIDRAYLSSILVSERSAELEIFCKAWPVRAGAFFPKTAFNIDWEREMLRCPQGVEMSCQPGKVVHFPTEVCAACPQRSRCTGSKSGRSVKLHADEKLLQELRVRQGTSEGRATLRERVGVEHDLSHIGHWQGDRARYRGERKNLLDLRRCAVVNNLHIFARRPEIMAQAA